MNAIICCSCGDTPAYSKDCYSLLYPNTPTPTLYTDPHTLLPKLPYPSNVYDYVSAIAQTKGKYSYYIAWDEKGNTTDNVNLLTGRKVA